MEILSVGIDIGTTTTQLIFSKITVSNLTGSLSMPNVKITNKEIIYRSDIYFTPMISEGKINLSEIKKIVDREYKKAKVKKESIEIGAIIITGEAARKENAKPVLNAISEFAGDFVVETAGADLESILAAYGAGTDEASKEALDKVINFDIGGGTTNCAIFEAGKNVDAFALDIGGRLIRFNEALEVCYISKKLEPIVKNMSLNICVGEKPKFYELKALTDKLANILIDIAKNNRLEESIECLFIEHKNKAIKANTLMFSGGVSEFIYKSDDIKSLEEAVKYGDIGALLGFSIREALKRSASKVILPREKIRATVIGAGSYSVAVSGSTIVFDEECIPIKNIPIVKLPENISNILSDEIINKVNMYRESIVALAFKGKKSPSYIEIKEIASNIIKLLGKRTQPIIVVIQNDFAKALGQTMMNMLRDSRKIICIDGIKVENGDYIDIGKPVASVLPVVIKTLIFNM